ncbi:MAG: sigma-54 dependent transcriptional regulator [Syntrophobacteraceae bacterium]
MKRRKVLVIDDEQVICDGCCLVLTERGYEVDICVTGRQGIHAALQGRHDVVLLDIKLPDLDGLEVLRIVRIERPDIYFIIITGYSTVQNAILAMKLGAFDYLAKPFSDDELILSVERAIDKKRLVEENVALRKEIFDRFGFASIVGRNARMLDAFEKITKVAPTDSTVLITGENGTGKELIARAIHVHSQRAARQFVGMDCSTLSPTILESELFGHVKGAFTGAVRDKPGIFEIADEGTLFLDDVANLALETQAKLLRVLETREYKPVGASHFKTTNMRLISATNRDLRAMVHEKTFREDLYYRLNVFPITLPSLRERKDDIPRLAYYFLRHFCAKMGKSIDGFTEDAIEALVNHDWPGNVRQLKNAIEHLVIMADHGVLSVVDLMNNLEVKGAFAVDAVPRTRQELMAMKKRILKETFGKIERQFLSKALEESNGNITLAADNTGMKRPNFSALMKKHGLTARDAGDA